MGDFWLRPGSGSLLMVAGGSGLAPILAMLGERLEAGEARPVHLYFGARAREDLYEREVIDRLQAEWGSSFRFFPVLSAEPAGSEWLGARGLVADFISPEFAKTSDAYLCGPPPMVDAALEKLLSAGVQRERIRADRFTTLKDGPAYAGAQPTVPGDKQ